MMRRAAFTSMLILAACATSSHDDSKQAAQDPIGTGPITLRLPFALGGGAGRTSVASSAAPKKLFTLGLKRRALPLTPPSATPPEIKQKALPASVDISQGAPSPGDQGQTGSCATWATGYSAMGWWDARTSLGGAPYAPMFLYAQVVQGDCSQGTDIGGDLEIMKTQGIDTAADYEPMQQNLDCATQPTQANLAVASRYRISDYVEDDARDAKSAIQNELAAGRPVVIGFDVYSNFMNADAQSYLVGAPQGTVYGGHAVTAFKYDDNGVWILNSWSSAWGLKGWAELSWDYVAATVDEVAAITGVVGKAPTPPPPDMDGGASMDAGGMYPPLPPPPPPPPLPDPGGASVKFESPADGSSVSPGDVIEIVVSITDANAEITDVKLVWDSPAGSTTAEMQDWGGGRAGIDINLDPSAAPGPRTVSVVVTNSSGQSTTVKETVNVR